MRPTDLALAGLVVVVWGLNFAVIKTGVAGVPPLLLGALRFTLAAFPAVFFVARPRVPWRLMLLYGLTIAVGQFAFLFTAIAQGMPTGLASLVLQSQAFFTLVFAALFLRERWGRHQLAGLVLAGSGLVLIGSAHGVSMPLVGFALSMAAACMWAMGNIVTRFITERAKAQTAAGAQPLDLFAFIVWSSLIPPLPFFALSLWLEGWPRIELALLNLSWPSVAAVAYLAWMATLLGYGLWTRLLSRYPANQVAPFSLLVPVVGVLAGWLLFNESLQAEHWAGAVLLLLGLAVNVFGGRLFGGNKPHAAGSPSAPVEPRTDQRAEP